MQLDGYFLCSEKAVAGISNRLLWFITRFFSPSSSLSFSICPSLRHLLCSSPFVFLSVIFFVLLHLSSSSSSSFSLPIHLSLCNSLFPFLFFFFFCHLLKRPFCILHLIPPSCLFLLLLVILRVQALSFSIFFTVIHSIIFHIILFVTFFLFFFASLFIFWSPSLSSSLSSSL